MTGHGTDIVADCVSSVLELEYHVQRYDSLLSTYTETGERYDDLEEAIDDVGKTWQEVDAYKEELDSLIADLEVEVDNGEASWYVEDVEGLLHTTMTVEDAVEAAELEESEAYDDIDDEIAATAIHADYEDLAAFNKAYVESVATIARLEAAVRDDDSIEQSPEQVRMDGDEEYVTLEERVRQQIELLEEAKEQF